MNTTSTRPAILDNVDALDIFSSPAATTCEARALKSGMVILDPDLGTPALYVDHRIRGSHGDVVYYAHDLDNGQYDKVRFRAGLNLTVMA